MKIPTCSPREDSRDRACVEIEISKLRNENSRHREISRLKNESSRNRAIELSKLKNENSRDCAREQLLICACVHACVLSIGRSFLLPSPGGAWRGGLPKHTHLPTCVRVCSCSPSTLISYLCPFLICPVLHYLLQVRLCVSLLCMHDCVLSY